MHIDFSAAVLANSHSPADANAFLRYMTRSEAASAWHDCGIEAAGQNINASRASCAVAMPTMEPAPGNEEVRAPRPARARGISMALAVEGAQAAVSACLASGYKVTALITDVAGVPVAMLSGDGAAAITQRIAMGKAQTVLKYRITSGEAAVKAQADTALMAQMGADPMTGPPRQGGIPIIAGSNMLGAFAVSGAPSGDKDEPCALAGLNKIRDRLN
jgi:uncharacterized protein GlcG (DUF336 family)